LMGMACETSKPAEIRKQIYMTIVSINILEAVRFYVSFICSFAFAENKKMVGNADIIKLIKRDEALHLTNTQEILKILHSEESEGFTKTAEQCQTAAIEMFERAAIEEKEWASYLFKDGSIIGFACQEEKLLGYLTITWVKILSLDGLRLGCKAKVFKWHHKNMKLPVTRLVRVKMI